MASREVEKRRRQEKHSSKRKAPRLAILPTILIVCEGKNTEPSYFNAMKFKSATIEAVGEGYNTVSLVERAAVLAKRKTYEEVWCVFDKDDFSDSDFNQAITRAKKYGYHVAYSNQAFEYWILLHFNDHAGGPLQRTAYQAMINEAINPLGATYSKEDKLVNGPLFQLMFSNDCDTGKERIQLAIQRAKRIYGLFDHRSPAKEESSTTVFQLLEHILSFKRY
ncbi:RloB family protein [Sphaerochaeta sp.]|uniref:RloB family protein n=1 Tax=Sphaerochaeta sp. TaxID=1972642 RepID=UPI003D0F0D93